MSATVAYTGVECRVSVLPHAGVSSLEHHVDAEPSRFHASAATATLPLQSENKTCVYLYEDKYSFSRIISGDSFIFDSHFESGNLASAFRFAATEWADQGLRDVYELRMSADVGADRHMQWFYFSVANTRPGRVLFLVSNFSKQTSLFSKGMRPLMHSPRTGWVRCGDDISYAPNEPPSPDGKSDQTFTLSFSHVFERTQATETVYFAYSHPYAYSDLQRFLGTLWSDPLVPRIARRQLLCKTLAGNDCDLLTITAEAASPAELASRTGVVILSRVHPGETNASWIAQGIIAFLCGSSTEACQLRERFVFKVVPMLNPDGVINGNNRCDISGIDLNRVWDDPDKKRHPTIYHAKELLRRFKRARPTSVVLDLHGHSIREGVFLYGCMPERRMLLRSLKAFADKSEDQSEPLLPSSRKDLFLWRLKLLPRVMERLSGMFSAENCSYRMLKEKSSCLRMVAFLELGIDCAYTVEASLGGKAQTHFSASDLLGFGCDLCHGMLELYPSVAMGASELSAAPHMAASESRHREAGVFYNEIMLWRAYYNIESSQGIGVSVMNPEALKELLSAPDLADDDDSENSDGALRPAPSRPRRQQTKPIAKAPRSAPPLVRGVDADAGNMQSELARVPFLEAVQGLSKDIVRPLHGDATVSSARIIPTGTAVSSESMARRKSAGPTSFRDVKAVGVNLSCIKFEERLVQPFAPRMPPQSSGGPRAARPVAHVGTNPFRNHPPISINRRILAESRIKPARTSSALTNSSTERRVLVRSRVPKDDSEKGASKAQMLPEDRAVVSKLLSPRSIRNNAVIKGLKTMDINGKS